MDFDKVLVLLSIVHKAAGDPSLAFFASEARKALAAMQPAAPVVEAPVESAPDEPVGTVVPSAEEPDHVEG